MTRLAEKKRRSHRGTERIFLWMGMQRTVFSLSLHASRRATTTTTKAETAAVVRMHVQQHYTQVLTQYSSLSPTSYSLHNHTRSYLTSIMSPATCTIDTNILNEDSLADMTDIGVSFFAATCGKNRGAFVIDPPDGNTYGWYVLSLLLLLLLLLCSSSLECSIFGI
jgi:hypothetical protein